jgi:hypothetical protein
MIKIAIINNCWVFSTQIYLKNYVLYKKIVFFILKSPKKFHVELNIHKDGFCAWLFYYPICALPSLVYMDLGSKPVNCPSENLGVAA